MKLPSGKPPQPPKIDTSRPEDTAGPSTTAPKSQAGTSDSLDPSQNSPITIHHETRNLPPLPAPLTPPSVSPSNIDDGKWKQIRYALTLESIYTSLHASSPFSETVLPFLSPDSAPHSPALSQCLAELTGKPVLNSSPGESPRHRYKSFLKHYRALCDEANDAPDRSPLQDKLAFITKQVARTLFREVDISTFPLELVQAVKTHSDPAQHFLPVTENSGHAIARRLFQSQQLILKESEDLSEARTLNRRARSIAGQLFGGELGVNYDPFLQGNTPYRLFSLQTEERSALCVRMGTTTSQTLPSNPEITPEFEHFIRSQLPSEHHLYINRQKRSGVEGQRSDVLEKSQNNDLLTSGLTVVTLPADGDFVSQSGHFGGEADASKLKAALIRQALKNKSGFYFPHHLIERFGGKDGFAQVLSDAFDKEAKTLGLPKNGPLSVPLRRAALFHFLNYRLVNLLVDTVEATSYNNTCKDDIDRGGMANAYMFAMQHRPKPDAPRSELESFTQTLEGVTFAPALIVKKRGVVPHRFADLINALNELDLWNGERP